MKRRTKKWAAVMLSAQTLAAGSAVPALAEGTPQGTVETVQSTANQPVSVKPGVLRGAVTNPVTNKPWAKTSVELVDPKTGKVIAKTRTDDQGRYDLGEVKEGKFIIRINGKITLPIVVAPSASAAVLNVAIPAAAMGKVVGAISWTTVALVGAGVVTAVGIPLAVGGGGGGGGSASPS